MNSVPTNDEQLRSEVSTRSAKTALQVLLTDQPTTAADACCAPTCCSTTTVAPTQNRAALPVVEAEQAQTGACCGSSCCSIDTRHGNVITSDL